MARKWQVSTHSRLKAAGSFNTETEKDLLVSTHSRLKAAGFFGFVFIGTDYSFNTQPPKGGWEERVARKPTRNGFQHTAA